MKVGETRMKKLTVRTMCIFAALAISTAHAWDPKDDTDERHEKAQEAKAEMLDKDPDMQRFFDSAVGKNPGAIEFTRTPCGPHSLASALVIINTPALLIA